MGISLCRVGLITWVVGNMSKQRLSRREKEATKEISRKSRICQRNGCLPYWCPGHRKTHITHVEGCVNQPNVNKVDKVVHE